MNRDERQEICISNWKAAGGKGILELCVGFGKTRCSLKIMQRLIAKKPNAKIIVIVPTEYLKGQWLLQIADWKLLHNTDVIIINSAIGERGFECDLLIVDEIHEACNDNRITLFKTIKHKLCLGLSGSLDRIDNKQLSLLRFLPVVDTITLLEAVRNDWVAKANEYKVLLTVDLTEYQEAHQRFLHHFAFFAFDFELAMACLKDSTVRYNYALQISGGQSKGAISGAMGEIMVHAIQFMKALSDRKNFVWSHVKKTEIARLIVDHRRDKKIITFSQTKAMAESIGEGMLMHSGQTKKKRGQIMDEFNAMECGLLSSAKALERGADIQNLSVAINMAFNSSKIAKTQKSGRVSRKEGDKTAEVYTLLIKGTMEEAWYNKSMAGTPYITIDESQLVALLKGEEYKETKEKHKEYLFSI